MLATISQHRKWFREFCKYEQMTGGPDPHMRAVIKLLEGLPYEEQVWRILLYVGVYNVPTAELLWTEFSGEKYLHDVDDLDKWLERNWHGLKLRRERRTVKSPSRLANYLEGYETTLAYLPELRSAPFDELWQFALRLPHVGRYAATKLTECWHRAGLVEARVPDIRAKGGWSPRAALELLGYAPAGEAYENDEESVQRAEDGARRLHEEQISTISMFELEVMLCEYKASYSTMRQYPGRSLDSELTYEAALVEPWGERATEHMRVRKLLSPEWALGELRGWPGVRDELGRVLRDYGYTWSDSLYDYNLTREQNSFHNPVKRRA